MRHNFDLVSPSSLLTTDAAAKSKPSRPRLITCFQCKERRPPYRDDRMAVFCEPCWQQVQAGIDAAGQRVDADPERSRALATDLFARIARNHGDSLSEVRRGSYSVNADPAASRYSAPGGSR